VYTKEVAGIHVHCYGAHIFHTSNQRVWQYVNHFAAFNRYTNSPIARYGNCLYNLPFNMNTFHQLWGVMTPAEAKKKIDEQVKEYYTPKPANLEEQAINLVGLDIYEKLIKGYTEKQWGRKCRELPAFIIKRLPVRFTFDNNYFNDRYQGIPEQGYTAMVAQMVKGIPVQLNCDYFSDKKRYDNMARKIVFTGMLDEFYQYVYGHLAYRSLRFEEEFLSGQPNYQGNAVVNYTQYDIPFTRVIEHKHFTFGNQPDTIITREYPSEWKPGDEPYYPINDERNQNLYKQYAKREREEKNVIFGGRLAQYRYYDMDQVIESALIIAERECATFSL
ncbi:MAG TPA: UDP-galactopyranose mutase, partial [Ruminococcaceae bacterium]|nr:UDP-galactopyranose mutase [Oscillospiraceae bacterium]